MRKTPLSTTLVLGRTVSDAEQHASPGMFPVTPLSAALRLLMLSQASRSTRVLVTPAALLSLSPEHMANLRLWHGLGIPIQRAEDGSDLFPARNRKSVLL